MSVEFKGVDPKTWRKQVKRRLVAEINRSATELYGKLSTVTPVGVGGNLRQSWQINLATDSDPVATLGQSSSYFLPLELGRKPGKGISQQGQAEVAIWGQRVLGMAHDEAKGFAYLLSRKYAKEGRAARGFAGLAKPKEKPQDRDLANLEPIPGGLIARAFKSLDKRLTRINQKLNS